MQFTELGRSKIRVSVMGLGGGGQSRFGQGKGSCEQESLHLVRRALELGVNLIDTSEYYGTETIVGKAIQAVPRCSLVLSSKKLLWEGDKLITPQRLRAGLEASLRRLRTDYLDIYHLHGVRPRDYAYAVETLAPELSKLRDAGKVRCVGVSEHIGADLSHRMLERAVVDNVWDVIMVGFSLINNTARKRLMPAAAARSIGVFSMAAVSRLSRSDWQRMQFLVHAGGAVSLTDAAYRYCRHEPGIHSVLFGTGNLEHLEANVASLLRPPLPQDDLSRLEGFSNGRCEDPRVV